MANHTTRRSPRLPVYFALLLVIAFGSAFLILFLSLSDSSAAHNLPVEPFAPATMTALLEEADAVNGNALVERYGCVVCHRLGAENGVAPPFRGLAERAAQRRPPLSAADYVYESITNPLAYVVEGYYPAMPQDYGSRLSERELGDIIAYLLSPGAH